MSAYSGYPTVSVVVLNHRRPQLLSQVIRGIALLDYPCFEVLVIGDQGHLQIEGLAFHQSKFIRYYQCDQANISHARNIGIRHARGDIIAFCDDDSVPERNWLNELVVPFYASAVGAVGGTVRGADGHSIQWQGELNDRCARTRDLPQKPGREPIFFKTTEDGWYGGIMGTNCAFRRTALQDIGGFDESFRYFLDETDVALRMADAGWQVAMAPRAEVYHFLNANNVRCPYRCPRDYYEIGASKAYFCKKHAKDPQEIENALALFREQKDVEIDTHLMMGRLQKSEVTRLMNSLDKGLAEGMTRSCVTPLRDVQKPSEGIGYFRNAHNPGTRPSIAIITGWNPKINRHLENAAQVLALRGYNVSLFRFQLGFQPLRMVFRRGLWEHSGGTMHWKRVGGISRAQRAKAEIARMEPSRNFDLILRPDANAYKMAGTRKIDLLDHPAWAGKIAIDIVRLPSQSEIVLRQVMNVLANACNAGTIESAWVDHVIKSVNVTFSHH